MRSVGRRVALSLIGFGYDNKARNGSGNDIFTSLSQFANSVSSMQLSQIPQFEL
jgi:hypothetical protein